MRRRDFIAFGGGAGVLLSLAARAQQPSKPRVGFLNPGSSSAFTAETAAFLKGLAETGFSEGRNVAIEYRWGEGEYNRLPALVADLVSCRVDVIAALGSSAPGRVAKAAASTIPIVFETGGDPVEEGLVAAMNRPGGNITGVSRMNVATDPKRLELLHELVPNASAMGCLVNPTSPRSGPQVRQIEDAARSLGLKLSVVNASAAHELDAVFGILAEAHAGGLLVAVDPSMAFMWKEIAQSALSHSVPTMSDTRAFISAGGLMTYGASLPDAFRQAGVYVGRILNGEKPENLPVMQPTKFELSINLKTAKAIGLTVPQPLLATADEVIE
jgi:putative tryptophan/tyrosine transport system substrate-binding protein